MSRVPYSSDVGSLMYDMVCSRPDLSFALSLVSRYMASLGKEHWKVVQWIFRHLRGTSNACLKFGRTSEGLASYVDSDFSFQRFGQKEVPYKLCVHCWWLCRELEGNVIAASSFPMYH